MRQQQGKLLGWKTYWSICLPRFVALAAFCSFALVVPAFAVPATDADAIRQALRSLDSKVELWAAQVSQSAESVDASTDARLLAASQRLAELDLEIRTLGEPHSELVAKRAALAFRVRELIEDPSRSSALPDAEPQHGTRRIDVPLAARPAVGSSAAIQACDSAPILELGPRAIRRVGGERGALLRFVAPQTARYSMDTRGSETDTTLTVRDACNGRVVASGDESSSLRASLQFDAAAGQTFFVELGADREDWLFLATRKLAADDPASISGRVRAQQTGEPLSGIPVWAVSDADHRYLTVSDVGGSFEFSGLAVGSYQVYTADQGGEWVNVAWPTVRCWTEAMSCEGADGMRIQLGPEGRKTGVDLELEATGRITGRVTDLGGTPLFGTKVLVRSTATNGYSAAVADTAGRFVVESLPAGLYEVTARAVGHRMLDDWKPVEVLPRGTAEVDLLLGTAGTIEVTVLDNTSGDPLDGAFVRINRDSTGGGEWITTASDGTYSYTVPGPGTYRAYANGDVLNDPLHAGQVWDGRDCDIDGCPIDDADPIVVADNDSISITFLLKEASAMEGTVTLNDAGICENATFGSVSIKKLSGGISMHATVQGDGSWSRAGLSPDYYTAVAVCLGYRYEMFDEVPCQPGNDCDRNLADVIEVPLETTAAGIDFTLDRLGVFEGRVTDGVSGDPIEGATIFAYHHLLGFGESLPVATKDHDLNEVETDSNGDYRFYGLEPDIYSIHTETDEWEDEAYDDLPCEDGCNLALADQVAAGIGTSVANLDFALAKSGIIEGQVTDSGTMSPLNGHVGLFDASGDLIAEAVLDGAGEYSFTGLDSGTYYLISDAPSPYINELHAGISCEYDGAGIPYCDPTTGTAVVAAPDTVQTVDFALVTGGSIAGTVTTDSMVDVLGGTIHVFDDLGTLVRVVDKDGSADYTIPSLPSGDYYLVTSRTGHEDELWPDVPCFGTPVPACTLSDGTVVAVAPGADVTGIDFSLGPLASISGVLLDTDDGSVIPAAGARVILLDDEGEAVTDVEDQNPWEFTQVEPGTYYLISNATNYFGQIYGGGYATSLSDPTEGTPIPVGIGDIVSGIEIEMQLGPAIRGIVTDGDTGDPVPGVDIDFWVEDFLQETRTTDADGEYVFLTETGFGVDYPLTYFVSTHNDLGFEELLFQAIPCPLGAARDGLCDPEQGTPVVVEYFQVPVRVDFLFNPPPPIFDDSFESGDTSAWTTTVGAN